MGSIISIDYVFNNDKLLLKSEIMKNIIESFNLPSYSVLVCNEKTITYDKITPFHFEELTSKEYSSVLLMCDFLNINNLMLNIIYYQTSSFFSMQIQLFGDRFKKTFIYDELEEKIIDYIIKSYQYLPFDYVVCENDGEVYAPDEINDEDIEYSILIQLKEDNFLIKKGQFLLNGTKRNE